MHVRSACAVGCLKQAYHLPRASSGSSASVLSGVCFAAHGSCRSIFSAQEHVERPRMSSTKMSLGVAPLPEEDEILADKPNEKLQLQKGKGLKDEGRLDKPLLKGRGDHYKGIIVDPCSLPADIPTFVERLKASLALWRKEKRHGIWLKIPVENVNLVAPAVEAGFRYHHAEPAYLMLTMWLPDRPCTLPSNASHQVGIGAFVLNDKKEVLAVQERNGPLKGSGVWKMPTGLTNQGEDIFAGAVREVKEETGVEAEFVEVVGFRQGHQVAFEKSDLFFVCILRPLSSKIVKQETEISAAQIDKSRSFPNITVWRNFRDNLKFQWMPLAEFQDQPFFKERSMLKKMLDVCVASVEGKYRGLGYHSLHSGFQKTDSYFYYNNVDLGD